jgi:hypothetical protein
MYIHMLNQTPQPPTLWETPCNRNDSSIIFCISLLLDFTCRGTQWTHSNCPRASNLLTPSYYTACLNIKCYIRYQNTSNWTDLCIQNNERNTCLSFMLCETHKTMFYIWVGFKSSLCRIGRLNVRGSHENPLCFGHSQDSKISKPVYHKWLCTQQDRPWSSRVTLTTHFILSTLIKPTLIHYIHRQWLGMVTAYWESEFLSCLL